MFGVQARILMIFKLENIRFLMSQPFKNIIKNIGFSKISLFFRFLLREGGSACSLACDIEDERGDLPSWAPMGPHGAPGPLLTVADEPLLRAELRQKSDPGF